MLVSQALISLLTQLQDTRTVWIGYSGGLDSTVLLHATNTIKTNFPNHQFKAVHVNHGLSINALTWEQHCIQICTQLNLPLEVFSVNARPKKGDSPENAARKARYKIFSDLLSKNDCLLTAHQQDDQAETLLLQLFRGTGIKGLAGMPLIKKFHDGFLARPLLNYPRSALQNYAKQNDLRWIDDESNLSLNFDRNYVRHQIFPVIKQRWPQINKILQRVSHNAAYSIEVEDDLATMDLINCRGEIKNTLSVTHLKKLSLARKNNLIRYWLSQLNYPTPNAIHVEKIINEILLTSQDRNALLHWDNVEIRRYQDNLYAMPPLSTHDPKITLSWNILTADKKSIVELPNNLGKLSAQQKLNQGLRITHENQITIRFRQGGEKCRPQGRKENHELKKLFQDWKIPPWERNRVPLLFIDEELAAVIGYCICEDFAVFSGELGWEITLEASRNKLC